MKEMKEILLKDLQVDFDRNHLNYDLVKKLQELTMTGCIEVVNE